MNGPDSQREHGSSSSAGPESSERVFDLETAFQVRRQVAFGYYATKIYDALQLLQSGSSCEIVCNEQVEVLKVALRQPIIRSHRMNQVDANIDTLKRIFGLFERKNIALAGFETLGDFAVGNRTRKNSHIVTVLSEF